MLFEAIEFATKAHSGQYRKTIKVPYIIHPLGVVKILIDYGCREEVVVAGVLHDTVEDTAVNLEEIHSNFGKSVAELVAAVSEPPKSVPWEERKQHTIDLMRSAPIDVLLITCADKLDNLRSIREDYTKLGESIWTCFSRPEEKQRWFFQSLEEIFKERLGGMSSSLFREFQAEMERVFR